MKAVVKKNKRQANKSAWNALVQANGGIGTAVPLSIQYSVTESNTLYYGKFKYKCEFDIFRSSADVEFLVKLRCPARDTELQKCVDQCRVVHSKSIVRIYSSDDSLLKQIVSFLPHRKNRKVTITQVSDAAGKHPQGTVFLVNSKYTHRVFLRQFYWRAYPQHATDDYDEWRKAMDLLASHRSSLRLSAALDLVIRHTKAIVYDNRSCYFDTNDTGLVTLLNLTYPGFTYKICDIVSKPSSKREQQNDTA